MSAPRHKTAVVTGGAGGLGLHIAKGLLARGWRSIVLDINKDRLAELPVGIDGFHVDVIEETSLVATVTRICESHGTIDVLVNNAGAILSRPLVNLMDSAKRRHDYEAFKTNIDINLNGVFLVGSVVAEAMVLRRTAGVIVNISSVSAAGNAGQSAYSAGKAGVEALTRVWAKELGPFGIRAVAVAPGFIDTPTTRASLSQQKLDDIIKSIPLRRLGGPENVVEAVLFAIDCDYLTGTTIKIDGGLTL